MLANNTNKITWVAVTIGILAALGLGSMTLFPSAMESGSKIVSSTVDKFLGESDTSDNTSYSNAVDTTLKASSLLYTYNASTKEATVTGFDTTNSDNSILVVPETVEKDGVTYKVTSVGYGAFINSQLKQVQLSDNVTSVGMHAFSDSKSLTKVRLSENLSYISPQSFDDTDISTLYIPKSVSKVYGTAFTGTSVKKLYYYSSSTTFTADMYGKDGSVFTDKPSTIVDLSK